MPLSVRLYFQIGLHLKDEKILKLIQSTLGVGKIYRSQSRADSVELQVSSIKDMSAIIRFFDNYQLITQKWADYILFKEAYELILNKQHLTIEGLIKLVEIKALIKVFLINLKKLSLIRVDVKLLKKYLILIELLALPVVKEVTMLEYLNLLVMQ